MNVAQSKVKIIRNSKVSGNYYALTMAHGTVAKQASPGQFVMVKVSDGALPPAQAEAPGRACAQPLLRRPFSIHRVGYRPHTARRTPNTIEILYEVLGQGTQILSRRKTGEYLDIIGPLGKGFSLRPTPYALRPILIAGGMGVAPLVFLAEAIVATLPSRHVARKPLVLIGAKTKSQILCEHEFKRMGCEVKVATDDGSRGFKGRICALLTQLLSTMDCRLSTIYACGPYPMLKEIGRIALALKMPAQVSLEAHMACGFGACLGCVVSTHQGYARVCKEGPVFGVEQIDWKKY